MKRSLVSLIIFANVIHLTRLHSQHSHYGSKKTEERCDNYVQSDDGSDEMYCSCVDRISHRLICDGYSDCPDSEDEKQCDLGCNKDEFSCRDGYSESIWYNQNYCLKNQKRCDGVSDCPHNGMDEVGCLKLNTFEHNKFDGIKAEGFLQAMIKGQWHTVCASSTNFGSSFFLDRYASKACEDLVGKVTSAPQVKVTSFNHVRRSQLLPLADMTTTESEFRGSSPCPSQTGYYVKCPPPPCGTPVKAYDHDQKHQNHQHHNHQHRKRGVMDNYIQGKIVGGRDTAIGDYPYLVAIYRNGSMHCGAALLSEQHLISAAHCFHHSDKYVYEVKAGKTRQYSWSAQEQHRMIARIISHEFYDKRIFLHDIAVIKVDRPFHLSKWVTTTCLATDHSSDPKSGDYCTVAGWGDLSEGGGQGPDHLKEVDLPVLPRCKEIFTKDAYQICAGFMEGGRDACQGDSGGPFICKRDGRHVQVGVVSFGRGCARVGEAGAYTRISSYLTWIEAKVRSLGPVDYTATESYYPCPEQSCMKSGGRCLFSKDICNRKVDCLNAEDEQNCYYRSSYSTVFKPDSKAYQWVREASHAVQEHTHDYGDTKLCGPSEFQCLTTKTCVDGSLRCNGYFDCSDQTDEKGCDCGQIIANSFPEHYCNMIENCPDGSDEHEHECNQCGVGMISCPFGTSCIKEEQLCDGSIDCPYGLDETDCVSLVRSIRVLPTSNFLSHKISRGLRKGYVAIRHKSKEWKIACLEQYGKFPSKDVCEILGFEGAYQAVSPRHRSRERDRRSSKPSKKQNWIDVLRIETSKTYTSETCTSIKVKCQDHACGKRILYKNVHDDNTHLTHEHAYPWSVQVIRNGDFKSACFGTLVSPKSIAVSTNCWDTYYRNPKTDYMVAITGFSNSSNIVASSLQQEKRIIHSTQFGDVTILKTKSDFRSDHFSMPICVFDGASEDCSKLNKCIRLSVHTTGYSLIFIQHSVKIESCKNGKITISGDNETCMDPRSFFVYCHREYSDTWVLAGFVELFDQTECFSDGIELQNPFYSTTGSASALYESLDVLPSEEQTVPPCDGVRSSYGNCIPHDLVCDGIRHTVDYVDERRCQRSNLRSFFGEMEHGNSSFTPTNGICPVGHFKCKNGDACVSISGFCDGKYFDCDDYSDEPENEEDCSCPHYLSMAEPKSICDGVLNCPYRQGLSDEYPCPCKPNFFSCGRGSSGCIHPALVCNGYQDCPNGEDEAFCIEVSSKLTEMKPERKNTHMDGFIFINMKGVWRPLCSFEWPFHAAKELCKTYGYKVLKSITPIDQFEAEDEIDEELYEDSSRAMLQVDTYEKTVEDYREIDYIGLASELCTLAYIRCDAV